MGGKLVWWTRTNEGILRKRAGVSKVSHEFKFISQGPRMGVSEQGDGFFSERLKLFPLFKS